MTPDQILKAQQALAALADAQGVLARFQTAVFSDEAKRKPPQQAARMTLTTGGGSFFLDLHRDSPILLEVERHLTAQASSAEDDVRAAGVTL